MTLLEQMQELTTSLDATELEATRDREETIEERATVKVVWKIRSAKEFDEEYDYDVKFTRDDYAWDELNNCILNICKFDRVANDITLVEVNGKELETLKEEIFLVNKQLDVSKVCIEIENKKAICRAFEMSTYKGFLITHYRDSYLEAERNSYYTRINKGTVEDIEKAIDKLLESRTREFINTYGRYEHYWHKYKKLLSAFESEEAFLELYDDIADEETYVVKINLKITDYEDVREDYESKEQFDDELDADMDYLEIFKGYLEDFDCDEIDERRLEVVCVGDKELERLEDILDEECDNFELIDIYTMYDKEGTRYEPVKNKDL